MKLNKILVGTLLLLSSSVYAQQINPMTQAMLDGYDQILKKDPKDYLTLYQRAIQYYQLGLYDNALTDIGRALQFTPEKEKDMKAQEYSMLSDIAVALKDYPRSLEAIERALSYSPENYAMLYKKGQIYLYLEKPEEAYRAFQNMQRLKSRSQEAFFGMAQASIMMGNRSRAMELMKEVENSNPSSATTYCRIGDLYSEMGETEKAATNYIIAYSLAKNPARSLESLVNLSVKDYSGVASALDYTVSMTDNKVPLYYLRATLAYHSGHYNDAKSALEKLLNIKEGREASVYKLAALTDLALGNPSAALENVDKGIAISPSSDLYVVKSDALRENGNAAAALIEAKKALQMSPNSVEAMMAAAKASIVTGQGEDALTYLSDVVMNDPEDILPLLLRGYVYSEIIKNPKQGASDYIRASNMEALDFPDVAYKALAKYKSGKKLDGDAIIENMLSQSSDMDSYYWAAVYYAQSGSLEKAKEYVDKAISLGYQNKYNLYSNKFPLLNIAPIRHLLNP